MDTENFQVKLFSGLRIGILGFLDDELAELGQLITEQEGQYWKEIEQIKTLQIDSGMRQRLHFVLVKSSEFTKYLSFLSSINIKAVDEKWLKQCIDSCHFINPVYFYLNNDKQ